MIAFLLGNKSQKETGKILELTRIYAARLSEEKWEYNVYENSKQIFDFLKKNELIDIACLDVTMNDGILIAEETRKLNEKSFIILIADNSISPMKYIRPGIKAESLLMRPYSQDDLKEILFEAVCDFMRKFETLNNNNGFVIENKEGKTVIPYDSINYFEARDKKIFVNAGNREISFYDTIDNLEKQLPDMFVRCHRSFIISKFKINKIIFSQNLVELKGDYGIPLSRTYKKLLKEWK